MKVLYTDLMPENATKHVADAKVALASGDVEAAFRHLRSTLEFPSPINQDEVLWREIVATFAAVTERIAGNALADKVRAVVKLPAKRRLFAFTGGNAPEVTTRALYELGYALIEEQLSGIAATFLAKANELTPGDEGVLIELVAALEGAGLHGEARRRLEAAPRKLLESSFVCAYLLAFETLLTADVALARERYEPLQPKDDMQRSMASAIDTLLVRAEALLAAGDEDTLNLEDLRGWHFVVNGTFLLHRSPHGFDDGMLGRYAFTQDTHHRCKLGLEQLLGVCRSVDYAPAAILAMPDKHSHVLAYAAAELFKAPMCSWMDDPAQPGLIIAYSAQRGDLNEQVLRMLHAHTPGQAFYEHAASWTAPFPIASDVANYLHQFNVPPWGERLRAGQDTPEASKLPADDRPAHAIAQDLLGATDEHDECVPNEAEDLAHLIEVAKALPEHTRPAMMRRTGPRFRCRSDSPVQSNRFS